MWTERGLPLDLARQVADLLKAHPEQALRVHAQEELGVVPDELPSPWTAAVSSFVCFSVGALIPLLTYLFGVPTLWPALAVGGVGLFVAGAIVARFTGRSWWQSGARQLLLGALAAAVTYVIGALIGAPTA
jgi:VIT1/CCC1 family predicted Fe2+/Mn2+ transporter